MNGITSEKDSVMHRKAFAQFLSNLGLGQPFLVISGQGLD